MIDKMPARNVVYGTPNELKADTFCKEMVYSHELTMPQDFELTISDKIPDGDYIIRNLANNQKLYSIHVTFASGLNKIGFTNDIRIAEKTAYIVLRKQGSDMILLEAYKVTGVN